VSESRGDGEPENGGQPSNSKSQPGNGGQSGVWSQAVDGGSARTNGQSSGGSQSRRAGDPVADFQRWLMRAGARSMANQVADQVKRTLGQERRTYGNVWDQATNEPPPDEPPECQWCPVCQAARAARTGGGLMASLADAGGALASMAQDAFSSFEQILKTQDQNRSAERTGADRPVKPQRPPGTTGPTP
jgi:hypothetical protein